MITRFEGVDGRRRLIDTLLRQPIVAGNKAVAGIIAGSGALVEFKIGDVLIQKEASGTDIFFLLTGEAEIIVNQRVVASRRAGQHVGEMALIDPSASRCADVVATQAIVACVVTESAFTAMAQKAPDLWRRLALELAERLRQRNSHVVAPNIRPHIFIGSSVESLPIARAIQLGLQHDRFTVKVWTDGVFGASSYTIESLENEIKNADFGLVVLAPEDHVISRQKAEPAPRDNVIFELGMCIGALSRKRSFIVYPQGIDLRIPSDLLGLTPLTYVSDSTSNLDAVLGPVCEKIRRLVAETRVK